MRLKTCIIENGNIFETDYMGNKKECIGVATDVFKAIENGLKEAVEKAETLKNERDEYYELGIKNGYIQKPKTPEEIAKEYQDQQKQILEVLQSMSEKLNKTTERLEVLENGHKQSVELVNDPKGNTKNKN